MLSAQLASGYPVLLTSPDVHWVPKRLQSLGAAGSREPVLDRQPNGGALVDAAAGEAAAWDLAAGVLGVLAHAATQSVRPTAINDFVNIEGTSPTC